MHLRLSVLAVSTVAVFLAAPALADDRGSMEDQLACTPDVYRLCSQFVPNEEAIVGCLKKNVANLSEGCHRVFTKPDSPAKAHKPQGDDDTD